MRGSQKREKGLRRELRNWDINIKQVQRFKYLESVFTVHGICDTAIRRRVEVTKRYLPKAKKNAKKQENSVRIQEKECSTAM